MWFEFQLCTTLSPRIKTPIKQQTSLWCMAKSLEFDFWVTSWTIFVLGVFEFFSTILKWRVWMLVTTILLIASFLLWLWNKIFVIKFLFFDNKHDQQLSIILQIWYFCSCWYGMYLQNRIDYSKWNLFFCFKFVWPFELAR